MCYPFLWSYGFTKLDHLVSQNRWSNFIKYVIGLHEADNPVWLSFKVRWIGIIWQIQAASVVKEMLYIFSVIAGSSRVGGHNFLGGKQWILYCNGWKYLF